MRLLEMPIVWIIMLYKNGLVPEILLGNSLEENEVMKNCLYGSIVNCSLSQCCQFVYLPAKNLQHYNITNI